MIADARAELTSSRPSGKPGHTETWFRRILILFSIVAGLGLLCHLGILLWAENSFTGPEAVVAAQSMMLARDGTLYYDLNHYPYTVCAYMPTLYLLEGGFYKLGVPAYTTGRLINFAAMLGIFALSWKIVLLYTRDRYCAWMAVLLAASSGLLLSWGTVGQVDTLAAMFALAAFYQYSRYEIGGERTLLWAGAFALLAFFTKQTMLACPAAIFVLLWFRGRRTAIQFGAGVAAVAAVLVLCFNTASSGRFLASTVFANMNPHTWDKLLQHFRFAALSAGPLMLVAAAGARLVIRGAGRAVFVYLGFALTVFVLIASKIGSDLNYQIEFTILLILAASLALHALDFFRLSFNRTQTWVTLLQLPLAVFLIVNFTITLRDVFTRAVIEQLTRGEIADMRPLLAGGGRVLSSDYNAMVRLRGRIDVEMLIYNWLVEAKLVNPEPVRRDIASAKFSTILLGEDVNHRDPNLNVELSTLPEAQIDEIRRHYRLVERNSMGVYVYKPLELAVEGSRVQVCPPTCR
ncbi:MAG: glycosyltransferase family 39 protein [Bryobacteraceae bacterium]|jgi:hypothetical protein